MEDRIEKAKASIKRSISKKLSWAQMSRADQTQISAA